MVAGGEKTRSVSRELPRQARAMGDSPPEVSGSSGAVSGCRPGATGPQRAPEPTKAARKRREGSAGIAGADGGMGYDVDSRAVIGRAATPYVAVHLAFRASRLG